MIAFLLLSLLAQGSRTGDRDRGVRAGGRSFGGGGDGGNGYTCSTGNCAAPSICVANVCGQYQYDVTTGTACACADVTQATGEVIHDARDSGAFCTGGNGNWLTDIVPGSLTWCANDQVRVMAGGLGDGGLGFFSEGSTKNWVPTADFSAVGWTAASLVAGLPTVYPPDSGPCPDGTITANRITMPAVTSAQYSVVFHLTACQNAAGFACSGAMYIMGWGGTDGGSDMYLTASPGVRFGYTGRAWTRAFRENLVEGNRIMQIGNWGSGMVLSEPAADILACFPQAETADHVSSYIPANTSRAVDAIRMPIDVALGWTDFTVSAETVHETASITSAAYVGLAQGNATYVNATGKQLTCNSFWSTINDAVIAGPLVTPAGSDSLSCNYVGPDSHGFVTCVDGVCDGGTAQNDGGVAEGPLFSIGLIEESVEIGSHLNASTNANQPDAVVKNIRITSAAGKSIFMFGDSVAAQPGFGPGPLGYGIAQQVVHAARGNLVAVNNYAVSGETAAQCKTRFDSVVAGVRLHPSMAARTYMLLQCGTNSLASQTPAQITTTLQQTIANGVDAGIHVTWATITPRGDNQTYCDDLRTVNSNMTTYAPLIGASVAGTYALLVVPDGGCAIQPQYLRDDVHLNDAGSVVMTNEWIRAGSW